MTDQLVHCDIGSPGIVRVKNGIGFYYLTPKGQKLTQQRTLQRIEKLVIPPMWDNVWICPNPKGHIQATGMDAKGRKQYLYHQEFTKKKQEEKFNRLLQFGENLPLVRKAIDQNLRKRSWVREKVLALVLLVLDEYYLRIGNNVYRQANGTYGLTTLRRKHLLSEDKQLRLSYKAKSGKQRDLAIENKTIAKLIMQCAELPGHELFKYFDETGQRRLVASTDVNGFIREVTGKRYSSKYFRTWGGSTLAIKHYPEALESVSQNPRKKLRTEIVRQVSQRLGNTMSVCEKYYIHPKVLDYLTEQPEKMIKYHTRRPDLKEYLEEEELVLLGILRK
ncbi:DNA topoisomerase IB [soil metagenome]